MPSHQILQQALQGSRQILYLFTPMPISITTELHLPPGDRRKMLPLLPADH